MKTKYVFWTSMAFLVLAGIFDMLCFWCVPEYTTSFYISIAFGNASILVYALSTLLMAKKGKYIYLSFQDGFIIGSYTIICVILNLLFALCRMNNVKANIITNVLILAVYLIFLFIVFANTATITAQLEYDKKERNAFYELKDKAEVLLNRGENFQINKKIESLHDKICSCQINRAVDVSELDIQILSGLNDLAVSLNENDSQEIILRKITKIMDLIDDRNRQITNALKR